MGFFPRESNEDRDLRSLDEQRSDNIAEAEIWIKNHGFEISRIGTPQQGEYFVNYAIKERNTGDCYFHWFVPDGHYVKESERKILVAEYTQLYGTSKVVPLNFKKNYRYCIVGKIQDDNKGRKKTNSSDKVGLLFP